MGRSKRASVAWPPDRATLAGRLHDLRQPLTSVRLDVSNAMQCIRHGTPSDATDSLEDALAALTRAEEQLDHLQMTVTDAEQ